MSDASSTWSSHNSIIMGINIDFRMLPMKAHYFLYNAGEYIKTHFCSIDSKLVESSALYSGYFLFCFVGTGAVVPYMPVMARQLGISTFVVGVIYAILPILGLISKPLFGALADR